MYPFVYRSNVCIHMRNTTSYASYFANMYRLRIIYLPSRITASLAESLSCRFSRLSIESEKFFIDFRSLSVSGDTLFRPHCITLKTGCAYQIG